MTRLVTKNPCWGAVAVDLALALPDRTGQFAPVPAAHLLGMDARTDVTPAFFTQADVARLLGVPERTLEGWRLTRSGPPWLKLGRHVRYDRDDVLAWARE